MRAAEPGGKLVCLDGLRGVAVLLVIGFHLGGRDPAGGVMHPAVAAAVAPFRYGYSGVHLFLVLSGFCLAHSLIRRAAAGRSPSYRDYMAARWWRIAPPYYAAMAVYLAAPAVSLAVGRASPSTADLSARQVGTHLVFAHGLFADTIDAINTPFWSLSLEFQFYLALPLLVACARRAGAIPVVAAVVAASLAWRWALGTVWAGHGHLVNGFLLGRLSEFALGMGLAFAYDAPGRAAATLGRPSLSWRSWLAAAVLALGGATALSARRLDPAADYAFGAGYAALLGAALTASECRGPADRAAGVLNRVFGSPLLVRAGAVSYSLYLTHSLFIDRTGQVYRRLVPRPGPGSDAAAVAVSLALVLAGGWAFYRLVERHFLRSIDARRAPALTGPAGGRPPPPGEESPSSAFRTPGGSR